LLSLGLVILLVSIVAACPGPTVTETVTLPAMTKTVTLSAPMKTIVQTQTITVTLSPEPTIPSQYSTYIEEELYSITYPSNWVPALSYMEEVFGWALAWIQAVDQGIEVPEGMTILFLGGIPFEEGYYPTLNVFIIPRTTGYWTLQEIVEADGAWLRLYREDYYEYSTTEIIVDGIEAVLLDSADNDPVFGGLWRYLQLYTVKDNLAWLVTCGCASDDFNKYKDDFYTIATSLRILK